MISYFISKVSKKKLRITFCVLAILSVISLQLYGLFTKEPDYLYKGYNEYIDLAKEYKDYQYIYIGINNYNHIKNMPEFAIYKESLILNENQLDLLKERNVEDKFILSIKSYLNVNKILEEVLKNTESNKYDLLLEGKARGFEANYYLITRN